MAWAALPGGQGGGTEGPHPSFKGTKGLIFLMLAGAAAFGKDADLQLDAFSLDCPSKLCYLFCSFLFCTEVRSSLTLVRAVLGQGFANASVPFPVVRTEIWAGLISLSLLELAALVLYLQETKTLWAPLG